MTKAISGAKKKKNHDSGSLMLNTEISQYSQDEEVSKESYCRRVVQLLCQINISTMENSIPEDVSVDKIKELLAELDRERQDREVGTGKEKIAALAPCMHA